MLDQEKNIPLSFQLLLPTSSSSSSSSSTTKSTKTGGKLTHTPSFEDFSLGTAADAEEELSPKAAAPLAPSDIEKKNPPLPPPPLARASAPGDLSHDAAAPPSTPSPTAAKLSSSSESNLSSNANADGTAAAAVTKQPSGATLWGSVFHPGRWGHRHEAGGAAPRPVGNRYYDNTSEGDKTTWEEVVKSERLQTLAQLPRVAEKSGGKNGDFVDASQLRAALGPSEDVEQLIAAARDGRDAKDEKVPFDVLAELLRNS